jgi:nucleoid-associated protein YgaU
MFDFVKTVGEKLFGQKDVEVAQKTVAQAPDDGAAREKAAQLNRTAAEAIEKYIASQGLSATGLTVTFDGKTAEVTVFGVAPDQLTREKIVLCCGNVEGVGGVKDMMSVDQSAPAATFYTVVKGDNLSKIAKAHYGNANKYPVIFEANKPMLKHPDKIYPGQVLRIPAL